MLEQLLIEKCAPSLAGIKSGNIVSYCYQDIDSLYCEIRKLNADLTRKGLALIPLKCCDGFAILYLYCPSKLKEDLCSDGARCILNNFGYECTGCNQCIVKLIERLNESQNFPHEIGLFLSYPAEDVQGFIDNKALNYKFSGYWKVYGDELKAKMLFTKYKQCTELYRKLYQNGVGLNQLAVAV